MMTRKRSSSPKELEIELVCRAIAEPTRRAILDVLAVRPRTTGELAEHFPNTTRFATMKHLSVLERAGLVLVTRRGRERWNHLNAVPLRRLHDRWVAPLTSRAAASLIALQKHLEQE